MRIGLEERERTTLGITSESRLPQTMHPPGGPAGRDRPILGGNIVSFLTRKFSWANWRFGPLKAAALTLGIVIGAAFADFWEPYLGLVGIVFLVTGLWVTILWVGAMRRSWESSSV
jgi:hypothetical protein